MNKKKPRGGSSHGKLLFSVTIADCDVQTFSAGGPGGQHQNKSETGVRIIHRPSGATGEARDSRSQLQNKQAAWRRMVASGKFVAWLNKQVLLHGRDLEAEVRESMRPENLRIEGKDEEGRWKAIG